MGLESLDDDLAVYAALAVLITVSTRLPRHRIQPLQPARRLQLQTLSNADFESYFRFGKEEFYEVLCALRLPEVVITATGQYRVADEEAFALLLRRLAYPGRFVDLVGMFHRSKGALSAIFKEMIQ